MSPAARELGLLSAAKAKEPVLAKARQIRAEMGLAPDHRLLGELILTKGDRA